MARLVGKTAIITGAASGCGEATAMRFAREGAQEGRVEEGPQEAAVLQAVVGPAFSNGRKKAGRLRMPPHLADVTGLGAIRRSTSGGRMSSSVAK